MSDPTDPRQFDIEDHLEKLIRKGKHVQPDGREYPDPTVIAPPVGFIKQPSLTEQIRAMVRSEALRQEAEAAGAETFEEADDFDVPDFDPSSPYENEFDPPLRDLEPLIEDTKTRLTRPPKPKKKSSGDQPDTVIAEAPEGDPQSD